MMIQKAILHIMDMQSDTCVFSQRELDVADYATGEFIEKHIAKILGDSAGRTGTFWDYSIFKQTLERYLGGGIDFTEFSTAAGTLVYDQLSQADEAETLDLLILRFTDEGRDYIGLLLLPNKTAYTHQVENSEDGPANKIIRYFALLPSLNQKITNYAIVDTQTLEIRLCDRKRAINGEETEILPDKVLQCGYERSPRDTVKTIKKIAGEVAGEHGSNPAIAVSRAKSCMIESAEQSHPFSPADMGEEIFGENAMMKRAFCERAMEAELPAKITVENPKIIKEIQSHKIKTDTGIEIKIPVEYLENSRYVEFVNQPDGTISIALKNIGKILNR